MKHIARHLVAALLGLVFVNQVPAATYFVNANGGSDSYNGSMPLASGGANGPWQTLAKLATATLAPNDTVYLACGAVWNETLKIKSSGAVSVPITIAAGPGACTTPPTIDGAVTIPAHQWVKHSGSIYKATLPVDLISNSNPGLNQTGWAQWAAAADSVMSADSACPGQSLPCLAFTSGIGTTSSIAIGPRFPLTGGVDYSASIQLRAPAGTRLRVLVRRSGPTYENLAPDQWVTATGDWQNVRVAFRAASSVANARIDLEVPATRVRVNLREAHVTRTLTVDGSLVTFVDGLQVRRAHHPNFGQGGNPDSPYATVASAGGKTTLYTAGLALPPGATLTTGLGATMRTINWAIEERSVTAVSGSRLTLSWPTGYDIQPGYGYYLTGALWMLDSPGESFFDIASNTLYVWMPDGGAPGDRVSYSGVALGVDLKAKANVTVKDIAIRHVSSGLLLTGSTAITLSGLQISDVANYGLDAVNCGKCTVQNSLIARTGLDAITVKGPSANDFSLSDSTILDAAASARTDGWRFLPRPSQGAVYALGARPSILRNTISGTGYAATFVGQNSIVADNYFYNTCLTLNDCGALYTAAIGNNATFRGNVIETVPGNLAGLPATPASITVGIYLDELNTGSTVTGNTVTGADYGIKLHNANGNTVANNVLFGNRRMQLMLQAHTRTVRATGDVFGNAINANLLVPTAGGPALYLDSEVGDTAGFATFSSNHYSALLSSRVIGERSPTASGSYTTAEWQTAGRESAAKSTQPVGYASFLTGATNLIPNGDLASGKDGWSSWNLTPPLTTTAVSNCGFANCIEMRSGASESLLSSRNFSVTAGQWYRVTFDAATTNEGQPINVVVRRGGGGSAGYEFLMPASESFKGSATWRRHSFSFQALKTIKADDPVTLEHGARVDFERNQPGTAIKIARLEMVTLTPALAALQVKLLLNRDRFNANVNCASLGVPWSICSSFVDMQAATPVIWPAAMPALSGAPVYTRDTTLTDTDGDGIADQQDLCPNTGAGQAVNSRGCAFIQ